MDDGDRWNASVTQWRRQRFFTEAPTNAPTSTGERVDEDTRWAERLDRPEWPEGAGTSSESRCSPSAKLTVMTSARWEPDTAWRKRSGYMGPESGRRSDSPLQVGRFVLGGTAGSTSASAADVPGKSGPYTADTDSEAELADAESKSRIDGWSSGGCHVPSLASHQSGPCGLSLIVRVSTWFVGRTPEWIRSSIHRQHPWRS